MTPLPPPSSRGCMAWWTMTKSIRRTPSTRGGRITPAAHGAFGRPLVRARTRSSAPLATCMTYAPATRHGHAGGRWWRRSKRLCPRLAPGQISGQRAMMRPRSPWRSSTSPWRHTHTSPHECTNLVWTDLAVRCSAGASVGQRIDRCKITHAPSPPLVHPPCVCMGARSAKASAWLGAQVVEWTVVPGAQDQGRQYTAGSGIQRDDSPCGARY